MHRSFALQGSLPARQPLQAYTHAWQIRVFTVNTCRRVRHKFNRGKVAVRMAHTVFVYGTLLSEEIVKILLNRNPESYAGRASGVLARSRFFTRTPVACSLQRQSRATADTESKAVYILLFCALCHRTN